MKSTAFRSILAAIILLFGLDIAYTVQQDSKPAERTSISKAESRAADALMKVSVPLHRDRQGAARWIEATEGELSDEAMRYLPDLPKLEWLEVGGGSVTSSGMKNLKKCSSLKRLYVHDIDLSGDELSWISGLEKLEALSLQRTGIDGSFLKNLKATDALVVLNLSGTKISDKDMDRIAKIKGLEVLALANTSVTGMGVAKLDGLERLNELNLMHCDIIDDDVEHFLTMPNLRIVYAEGCSISDMAVFRIISRYPMLAIFR